MAATRIGAVDEGIPEKSILAILANNGKHTFKEEALLSALRNACGWYRAMNVAPRLTNTELAKQARVMAALAEELQTRIAQTHRDVMGAATTYWARSGTTGLSDGFQQDLIRLKVIMGKVATDIEQSQCKPGTKTDTERKRAFSRVYDAIRKNSTPQMRTGMAQGLARDLLAECLPDVAFPNDPKELRKMRG